MRRKRIVVIGGGTGTFTLLSGLKQYPLDISVIISTADDGGSSGILRKEFGVMPPGDIRQCLLGLSHAGEGAAQLFAYRFERGELKGHVTGNIILAALEKISGSAAKAIAVCAKALRVKDRVIPVTLRPTVLTAILKDGRKITGEHYIDEPAISKILAPIKKIIMAPKLPANPRALKAVAQADLIVIGPGDLYTSILPNFLPLGMPRALAKSRAKKVFICSLMTKYGQTDNFKASGYARELLKYMHGRLDVIVVNKQPPAAALLKQYRAEKARMVKPDIAGLRPLVARVIQADLLSERVCKKTAGDKLKRSLLRHDSGKLAALVRSLLLSTSSINRKQ